MSDTNHHPSSPNESASSDATIQRAWDNYAAAVDPQRPLSAYDVDEHSDDADVVIFARHARDEVEPAPTPTWPHPA